MRSFMSLKKIGLVLGMSLIAVNAFAVESITLAGDVDFIYRYYSQFSGDVLEDQAEVLAESTTGPNGEITLKDIRIKMPSIESKKSLRVELSSAEGLCFLLGMKVKSVNKETTFFNKDAAVLINNRTVKNIKQVLLGVGDANKFIESLTCAKAAEKNKTRNEAVSSEQIGVESIDILNGSILK